MFASGVRLGDAVPLFIGRSTLLVLAKVALLRLGAAYALIDLASPPARRRAMLDAIAPSLVIDAGRATLRDSAAPGADANAPEVFDIEAWWRRRGLRGSVATSELWLDAPANRPAYVMFTSGFTGELKGVLAPASGIARLVRGGHHIGFDADQRCAFARRSASTAAACICFRDAMEAVLKCFGVGRAGPPCQVNVTPQSEACTWQQLSVPALGRAWLSYPCMAGGTTSTPLAVALNAGHR